MARAQSRDEFAKCHHPLAGCSRAGDHDVALDRGIAGPLIGPSAYFMKSPPVQFSDEAAHEMVEGFILGNGESKAADWTAFFDVSRA